MTGEPWEFAADYRLGVHWQAVGDYPRAHAAYRSALEREPDHEPSLFNFAVVKVRLEDYDGAWEMLDKLEKVLGEEGKTGASSYPIKYYRALIEDYRNHPTSAAKLASELADDILEPLEGKAADADRPSLAKRLTSRVRPTEADPRQRVGSALRMPALTLAAGIHIRGEKRPEVLTAAAEAMLAENPKPVDRPNPRDAAQLITYVRAHAEDDARTHYNLACFAARLSAELPSRSPERRELRQAVVKHTERAVADPKLLPWAKVDPSLELVHDEPKWRAAIERFEGPSPAAAAPVAGATPEVSSDEPRAGDTPRRIEIVAAVERALAANHVAGVQPETALALTALTEVAPTLRSRDLEIRLAAAVATMNDPLTIYRHPVDDPDVVWRVPFVIEACTDPRGYVRFLVSVGSDTVPFGAAVTRWNGVPMQEAIDLRAERIAGESLDARRARALASLTHRPARLLAPFAEEDVIVTLQPDGEGPEVDVRVVWEPSRVTREPWPEGAVVSVDPLVGAIARARPVPADVRAGATAPPPSPVRLPWFTRDAVDSALKRLSGLPHAVLDVRGNPGGDVAESERLLGALSERVWDDALEYEFRVTETSRREVARRRGLGDMPKAAESGLATVPGPRAARPPADDPAATGDVPSPPRRILLLVDALAGGATDVFVARFADLGIGSVLSTSRRACGAGHFAVPIDLGEGAPEGLQSSLRKAQLEVSIARALRSGKHVGRPLATDPVVPDHVRHRTPTDVISGDSGLLEYANNVLTDERSR